MTATETVKVNMPEMIEDDGKNTKRDDPRAKKESKQKTTNVTIIVMVEMMIALAIGYGISYVVFFYLVDFEENTIMVFLLIGCAIASAIIHHRNKM